MVLACRLDASDSRSVYETDFDSHCGTTTIMKPISCWTRFWLIASVIGHLTVGDTVHADDKDVSALLKTFDSEFISIAPGKDKYPASFEMGDSKGEPSTQPQHTVTMKNDFAIAKYEVPQNLYDAVMGTNPSRWKGLRNSVELMTWKDANEFCKKITRRMRSEKLIGDDEFIRLPSEAEWEYCCRAGTTTRYSFGDQAQREADVSAKASILDAYGWHTGNAQGNDPAVGALKPNPWGLYDMHGYLWEFTADSWSPDYQNAPADGSAVKPVGEPWAIVLRGGSWKDDYKKLGSTARRRFLLPEKDDAVGIRCVKSKTAN